MKRILLCLMLISQFVHGQNFEEVPDQFINLYNSSISIEDLNNDNLKDVLICGWKDFDNRQCDVFLNEGDFNFELVENNTITGVSGTQDFGDVDNDGDLDFILIGSSLTNGQNTRTSKIFLNDGSGHFEEDLTQNLIPVYAGGARFGDLDGDGDLDLMITGSKSNSLPISSTTLYWNDGSGNFQMDANNSFKQLVTSSLDFADIDGDGDLDILLAGEVLGPRGNVILYENLGTGQEFAEIPNTTFASLRQGEAQFADIDNDDDMDIILIGRGGNLLSFVLKLYLNNGVGDYVEQTNFIPLNSIERRTLDVVDFDNDGDNDIIIIGEQGFPTRVVNLYANDGENNFSFIQDASPFEGVALGDIGIGDLDNDTDQDIILSGANTDFDSVTKVYRNMAPVITSLEENLKLEEVINPYSVSPNPITENQPLNIKALLSNPKNISIGIVDVYGKTWFQENYSYVTDVNLSVDHLDKGVYFLYIFEKTSGLRMTEKIIKQ